MKRLIVVVALLVGQGCASSRPSYVKPDFEDVGDVCDKGVEIGKVALLATSLALVGLAYLVYAFAESSTE